MRRVAGRQFIVIGLTLILSQSGCRPAERSPSPPRPRIRVAAASDLQVALPEVIAKFQAKHRIIVEPVFGASGQLAKQIGQGGPFDLFLSANRAFVEDLAEKGSIEPKSVRRYGGGVLVLVLNRKSGVSAEGVDDLARPEIKKIAIANPKFAPYGVAASQAIDHSIRTAEIRPKVVMADSVRHALQFVQTGNAEAGLVALSVASVPEVKIVPIDAKLHDPIDQYQGIVTHSENKPSAETFADYLRGRDAREVLGLSLIHI